MTSDKKSYHHGDLKPALLDAAEQFIQQYGVAALSLRKLAELVGVSRTAAYHHFDDKNALLCAIAGKGFAQWQAISANIMADKQLPNEDKFAQFCQQYLVFATQNPHVYDLMFGSHIWQQQQATPELTEQAYPSFQFQRTLIEQFQQLGVLDNTQSSLRLSQVIWGSLHGIARLINDGVYQDNSSIEPMCQCLIRQFTAKNR